MKAYDLRGESKDYLPANQGRGVEVVQTPCSGQEYKQTIEVRYLDGAATADRYISIEKPRRLQRACACFQLYKMEIYNRTGVRSRLKVRLLNVKWSRHHSMVAWCRARTRFLITEYNGFTTPRCSNASGHGNGKPTNTRCRTLTRFQEHRVDSARTEYIFCEIRSLEERVPQRVMFGEHVGVWSYSGGLEKD